MPRVPVVLVSIPVLVNLRLGGFGMLDLELERAFRSQFLFW